MAEADPERRPLLANGQADDTTRQQRRKSKLLQFLNSPKDLTVFEQTLIAALVFCVCLAAIGFGLFAGQKHINARDRHRHTDPPPARNEPSKDEQICLSPACVEQAADILLSLDTSVDPCDDFYTFANGNWLKRYPVPEDKGMYGAADAIRESNKRILLTILDSDTPESYSKADKENLDHLKTYYRGCLDEDALDRKGAEPLLAVLKPLIHGWRSHRGGISAKSPWDWLPVPPIHDHLPPPSKQHPIPDHPLPKPDPTRQSRMTSAISYLHLKGVSMFWDNAVEGDVRNNPEDLKLWLSQADLGLPDPSYYKDKDALTVYKEVVRSSLVKTYVELGMNKREAEREIPRLAEEVVHLETKIANISWDVVDLDDPLLTYNPYTTEQLANLTGHMVDFQKYFSAFLSKGDHPALNKVIVATPSFLSNLTKLVSEAKDEILEAYFVWKTCVTFGLLLGPDQTVRKEVTRLNSYLTGVEEGVRQPRAETCLNSVQEHLGFLIGRYYAQEAFPGNSKAYAESIIHNVIKAFQKKLPAIDWLDPETRKKAEIKANAIRIKIGYPATPNTEDPESLREYYADQAPFKAHDHFGNVARALEADVKRMWNKIGKKVDPGEWEMIPSEVNAYYNPSANEIVFPSGILQGNYFSVNSPAYLAYGSFGCVAGHELSHAFDKAGRLYDEHGKLTNWWTNETSHRFNGLQQCIIDQYAQYYVQDAQGRKYHINSRFTVGEDAADAGGIGQAFQAWKDGFESEEDDPMQKNFLLPGLNYTREQLFFIGYARGWVRGIKPAEAVRRIRTDPHSPTNFRVLGPLSNEPEFARAFKCPVGSRYNPEKKCKLW